MDGESSIPIPPPPPPIGFEPFTTTTQIGYSNGAYDGMANGAPPAEDATIEMDDDAKAAATYYEPHHALSKAERKRLREVLYFQRDPSKRIDYVLAYEDTDNQDKLAKRNTFKRNLRRQGLLIEQEFKKDSVDGKTNFMKLHVTWKALKQVAELLYLKKRIKMNKDLGDEINAGCCAGCVSPCTVGEPFVMEEDDYFTAEFDSDNTQMFEIDDEDTFFTNSERSLICREIINRTEYTRAEDSCEKMGINKLIKDGVFKAAYPLHEGNYKPLPDDPEPFVGKDKDRARLYEAWARPGRWFMYQPLDLVRQYFGEKVGIYFAWLGYYTTMLIPASIAGLAVVIYGGLTYYYYPPSEEICDESNPIVMCPECDKICDYHYLADSCLYSRLTYVFDNWATVAFAGFMSVWATVFLEFWKRYQKSLEYDWDVADFDMEEPLRPQYEFRVKRKKKNPVTLVEEPEMGWWEKVPRMCLSYTGVLFMMILVLAAIVGVIFYRIIVVVIWYALNPEETFARLATSTTASVINFVLIVILNILYQKIAEALTELENPRTWTEYEDGYTFKMYLFQFVNYYGTIIYIAYFKGSFVSYPGDKDAYILGKYQQDTCDPSGCLVDLFIQLATIMILKQVLNNCKELFLPKILAYCRAKKSLKGESDDNLYMRWEQDLDLGEQPQLGLFEEYLEMVIQYGFVTIFVAAFPLAPLFALINNIVEIRLDAYKFVAVWRRNPALKAQDIGIWYSILQTISFLSILTNAFIIGYTSDFVPKMVYYFTQGNYSLEGYIQFSLSYFNTADFIADARPGNSTLGDVQTCRFRGFHQPPESDNKYEYSTEFWVIFTARLIFVIVFEHFVFVVTYMVAALIPDVPARVRRLQVYERELTRKMRFDASFKPDYNEEDDEHQLNTYG